MGKTVVIYKSKYGAAKQYAQWLGEALDCPVLENKGLSPAKLAEYDTIILGGGIYAGGIAGIALLQKNIEALKGKTLMVFAVGASPVDETAVEAVKKRANLQGVPFFYFRGAWDESKMNMMDKMLCGILKKMVAKQDPAAVEPGHAAIAEYFGKCCDWTDKKSIEPILKALAG